MAVLYRANASSRALEEVFMRKAVPYRVLAGLRFYDRKEIRDMIAYLRLIKNPDDDISLKRIINVPARKIGKTTVDRIAAAAEREGCSLLRCIEKNKDSLGASVAAFYDLIAMLSEDSKELTIDELVAAVYEKTGYKQLLKTDEKAQERMENVDELINGAAAFREAFPETGLSEYMDNLALISDIDNYDEDMEAAVLMTMHASKGLEFPIVFICGFDEGIFPGPMSMYNSEEMEEERRLCYVGITRAKKILYLTCAKNRMLYGKTSVYKPSRFLSEIPEELTEVSDDTQKFMPFDLPGERDIPKMMPKTSLFGDFEKKSAPVAPADSFRAGDAVIHKKFGRGIIISATPVGNDIHYEIAFDSVGTKNLLGLYAKLEKGD
jgi:DNA helicase-2/ATP-dependent DNA helicase PcrA